MEKTLADILQESSYTVLYFYPKDNTPGCTVQAQGYSELMKEFKNFGIQILGCSSDNINSHHSFQTECELSIPLISDPDKSLIDQFGVFGEKNLYGKIVKTLIRSVFLLDSNGKIIQEWRNVRAKGNAAKIFREVQAIIV